MAEEADLFIPRMKEEGCEFIIVSYHGGLGDTEGELVFGVNTENQTLRLIAGSRDIDLVIAGHDHSASYSGSAFPDAAALGLAALRSGLDTGDEAKIVDFCRKVNISVAHGEDGQHTFVEGEDVTGLIRTPEVGMAASTVSRYAEVRKEMVRIQQRLAAETDMLVDGRDICMTVLPNATAKIFLTAAQEERARRRWLEMKEKGQEEPFEKVLEDLRKRDEQDMNRPVEPLRQAPDAELVDSTHLTFDETVDAILRIVEAKRRG